MLEFLGSGILGSLFGGLFRLAPELLKHFDKKNEREHELRMFTIQTDIERMRGEFRVEEKYVDYSISQLNAMAEAYKEQSNIASKSYKWVTAASAMVRPGVTYVLFILYVLFKLSLLAMAINSNEPWLIVVGNAWSPEDFGMLNMILTFWFVGRSIERYTPR